VVVSVSIVALLFTSSPPMLSLALLALWAVVEYAALRYQVAARYREFDRDFPVLLTAMSSAVRTGVDLRGAIKGSQQYFPPDSVIASELRKLVQGWDRGEDDETAFASFGRSVDHPDVPLFLAAARLALSHGTSFAETLHRLAKVCRQRQSFRRKVRAALAMQRMSSVGILLCALCIAGFQLLTGRAAVVAAYHHPTGRIFLALGVGLIFSGVLWMSRIGLRKV
jgi:Flp pilus assembly protein TadB